MGVKVKQVNKNNWSDCRSVLSNSLWPHGLCYWVKSLQSCQTLCDPIDCSPPGSPVPGVLQARTLEWVAISFFNAWKWKLKVKSLSHVRPSATPWTAAFQTPPSMGFSRPEYWSGWPFPFPGDLSNPGIELRSLALQVDSLPAEQQGKPKNTGVGSLSLLQGIFPTQELKGGLLHCRWILYQLSHKGSPNKNKPTVNLPPKVGKLLFLWKEIVTS